MMQAEKLGKPWGVGEAGGAYYATPEQVAKTNGERAYVSFEGRMEGIAAEAYKNLLEERNTTRTIGACSTSFGMDCAHCLSECRIRLGPLSLLTVSSFPSLKKANLASSRNDWGHTLRR